MEIKVSYAEQTLPNDAVVKMIGFGTIVLTSENGQSIIEGYKKEMLKWKQEFGDDALVLRASMKLEQQLPPQVLSDFALAWNKDEDIQAQSATRIQIDVMGVDGKPAYRFLNLENKDAPNTINVFKR